MAEEWEIDLSDASPRRYPAAGERTRPEAEESRPSRPRRRPPRRGGNGLPRLLLVAVGAVVVIGLALVLLGGGEDEPDSGTVASATEEAPSPAEDQEVGLGEAAELDGVLVTVTAMTPTANLIRPERAVRPGTATTAADTLFYQAFVYIKNGSDHPVRVDPEHFVMAADDEALPLVERATGPPARTLLPGASTDLILTYAGGAGLEPTLVYRPPWSGATVSVSGLQAPAGLETGTGS